ncbi:MAG: sigma-70 family RNA polymerase sigma factor [Arthrospira sp. SH-MAG29]|nr:sigma-70 family RNA polymerase sigma factor [Arthrospira sp. SH-MAG29]MBS0015775.1 sigma-70 family RNA polymerase sigma factor [Arthrospira sp. SH-MAG29]
MKIEDPIVRYRRPEKNEVKPLKNPEEEHLLNGLSEGEIDAFWPLWKFHQNYLYNCCISWMGNNRTEAEEALSIAMLKARDKLPKYAPKITNLRAWLTRLTHNLCLDIHRERRRKSISIDNIEDSYIQAKEVILCSCESPESQILRHELRQFIQSVVNQLPERLRIPFILRYDRELSYPDIVEKLGISRDNAYKRIQQARDILAQKVRSYLSGVDPFESTLSESFYVTNNLLIEDSKIDDLSGVECKSVVVSYHLTATCLD